MKKKKTGFVTKFLSKPPAVAACAGGLLILSAIAFSTNHFFAFFSLEGLMIVGGGVLSVAFMSYHRDDVEAALQAIREMFRGSDATHHSLHNDMIDILTWARIVKEKGMRAQDQHGP